MSNDKLRRKPPVNKQRRILLQGASVVGVASFAPAVVSKTLSANAETVISGQLVSMIANPVKTLVLHNQSDKEVIVSELTQGAFMFDGSIVDCNTACQIKPISIPPNQSINIQFDKRDQSVQLHRPDEFRRIQSRVTRLHDGTRVIPFSATVIRNVATIA